MKNKKIWVFILVGALIISLGLSIIMKVNAAVNDKPAFEVQISVNPNTAKIGQDITISGILKPQPFEVESKSDTYVIDDIEFNGNFANGIILYVGGNTVDIDDVVYKKVSEENKIIRFEAEEKEIPFSFTIKGSEEVKNYNLFENSNITFSWDKETVSVNIPETIITINEDGEIPKINGTLKSSNNIIATTDEDIDVTYTITPREFSYILNTSSGNVIEQIKEAVFLVDLSSAMNKNDLLIDVGKWIENVLVNNSEFKKNGMKFGMLGYADGSIYPDNPKDNNDKKEDYYRLFDISNGTEKQIFKSFLSKDGYLSGTDNSNRNIGSAIKDADDILSTKGSAEVGKAIILISSGKVNYSEEDIAIAKNKGYKIISLYLDLQGEVNDDNNTIDFKTLHNELLGNEEDYFISVVDEKNNNKIKLDMEKILNSVLEGIINPSNSSYVFNDVKLNFDLNENFEVVSELVDSGSSYVYNVPEIKYTAGDKNADGTYRYAAVPFDIFFKIKAKSGKIGDLSFGLNPVEGSQEYINKQFKNFISYTKINKDLAKMPIDTPIISIRSSDIQHGIYEGINSTSPIYTQSIREFAKGSNVTMGALFNTVREQSDISLTVSPQLTVNDDVKIYEVLDGGDLNFISNMTLNNGVYSYALNSNIGNKILVLYNVTGPDEVGTYTNTIYVGTESKDAVIKTKDENLPDLF